MSVGGCAPQMAIFHVSTRHYGIEDVPEPGKVLSFYRGSVCVTVFVVNLIVGGCRDVEISRTSRNDRLRLQKIPAQAWNCTTTQQQTWSTIVRELRGASNISIGTAEVFWGHHGLQYGICESSENAIRASGLMLKLDWRSNAHTGSRIPYCSCS